MIDVKKFIDRLSQALAVEGKYYTITTKRFKSNVTKRYCTKYIIEDAEDKSNRIEVYNKVEILKYLVREYSRATGRECPESCVLEPEEAPRPKRKRGSIIF